MLSVLDLFSGIGGFSLGLERTGGFTTVAFCERDPYARSVLTRHWPGVPCFDDVRQLGRGDLGAAGVDRIDVVCGGFPCQDISFAGKGAGLAGERSGLWREMHRIIAETRPRFVIAENVSALRSRGLDAVLGGLVSIGYDAEWHCIPASAVGAPHRRDRIWIVAYATDGRREQSGLHSPRHSAADRQRTDSEPCHAREAVDHPERIGRDAGRPDHAEHDGQQLGAAGQHPGAVADAEGGRRAEAGRHQCDEPPQWSAGICATVDHAPGRRHRAPPIIVRAGWDCLIDPSGWLPEPDVGRVADGVPRRVDRLRCLGNAVVPQIPELIGRAILASFRAQRVSAQETTA